MFGKRKKLLINIQLSAIHQIIHSISIARRKKNTSQVLSYFCEQFKNKTSIYIGVSWNKHAKKWQAELYHNQKRIYGRLYDKEEDAAMKVNLLCDIYEVKRKNPMIDIELFEDHQVIHSLRIVRAK